MCERNLFPKVFDGCAAFDAADRVTGAVGEHRQGAVHVLQLGRRGVDEARLAAFGACGGADFLKKKLGEGRHFVYFFVCLCKSVCLCECVGRGGGRTQVSFFFLVCYVVDVAAKAMLTLTCRLSRRIELLDWLWPPPY